jgi:hypothetical protein
MSMILLEPAYKILHATVKFKRRTISVSPHVGDAIDSPMHGVKNFFLMGITWRIRGKANFPGTTCAATASKALLL